ncbi:TPA: hypothetical protein JDD71_002912 [Salmonella enterica subsp. salamae]|nr:hypothetical protein [Salmonella enterica subsp. salamae]EHI7817667.1 hypothetical protein [Salmonella enterica]ECJ5874578.1 hypothetical protein [Salmonella enterica subsp. salamae]HAU3141611.1 hypothetical protein [Salmonella enterica]HAU3146401.1 hypothetical protein [Salmonella enterica subsp. salamae]
MKRIADNIYTADDGRVSITPSIDVIWQTQTADEMISLITRLFPFLVEHGVVIFNSHRYHMIISGDENDFFCDEIIDNFIFAKIKKLFITQVSFPVRKRPVALSFFRYDEKTQNNTELCCLTCSQNFFSDDPVILNLRLSTGVEKAYENLIELRGYIIELARDDFFYSSIGYRFVVNVKNVNSGIKTMENMCMRYLGVDLDDVFSLHTPLWFRHIRTINWETTVNIGIVSGGTVNEIKHWRTGSAPSLCDRNSGQFQSICEYKAKHVKLKPIIYTADNLSWLSEWPVETYSRWSNRWNEINITTF